MSSTDVTILVVGCVLAVVYLGAFIAGRR